MMKQREAPRDVDLAPDSPADLVLQERHTRAGPRTQTSESALLHPLWWAALVLLIVNDHLLKGVGLLPSMVTGKLSDFAGLLVAPLLTVELLRARSRAARAAAFTLVALPFAAINLSPAAARLMEEATAAVGLPWRVIVDPTDLVAFVVFPIAWSLRSRAKPSLLALQRLAVGGGAVACIASGFPIVEPAPGPDPSAQHIPVVTYDLYLANTTERAITLDLRRAKEALNCEALLGRVGEVLDDEVFDEETSLQLEPGARAPIARVEHNRCGAVLVRAPGLSSIIAATEAGLASSMLAQRNPWSDRVLAQELRIVTSTLTTDGPIESQGALRLEWSEAIDSTGGADFTAVARFIPTLEERECEPRNEQYLTWSDSSLDDTSAYLEAIDTDAEGCLLLTFDRSSSPDRLCIPRGEFPFEVDEVIHRTSSGGFLARSLEMVSRRRDETVYMQVYSGPAQALSFTFASGWEDRDCGGHRLGPGEYRVPLALRVDGETLVRAGESAEVDRYRVFVGRAERFVQSADRYADESEDNVDVVFVERIAQ